VEDNMRTFYSHQVHSEILDRIDGLESLYTPEFRIFDTERIKRILNDTEDDTNENTKVLLENFMSNLGEVDRFAIIF